MNTMKNTLPILLLFVFIISPKFISANSESDSNLTIEAADIVISAFSGDKHRDDLAPHLSSYLLEISLHGHSLPDEI
tara:strand:- start:308 stop:538 length:231 start_codon:yes stop_codon:yes gene_type:complete